MVVLINLLVFVMKFVVFVVVICLNIIFSLGNVLMIGFKWVLMNIFLWLKILMWCLVILLWISNNKFCFCMVWNIGYKVWMFFIVVFELVVVFVGYSLYVVMFVCFVLIMFLGVVWLVRNKVINGLKLLFLGCVVLICFLYVMVILVLIIGGIRFGIIIVCWK